ncbi:MAG: RNA polymerase sigma factor [Sedimentibacter sp.]
MIFSTFSNDEENDLEFITRLYENYGKVMWKYAYKLSNDYDVSNDMVSMAFLKIIEKVEMVRKVRIYKIKSYLISIVKNTFLNYKKNEKSHINYDDISEIVFNNRSADFTAEYNYSDAEEALYHMPEPYKSVLYYRYVYEELSYDEIARLLDINVSSIRMYKKRAVEMLKERLEILYQN